jgi:hypothetical protein
VTARELAHVELAALLSEIDEARHRMAALAEEIGNVDPGGDGDPSRAILALLAVDLHSWYSALESLLERILAAVDGSTPTGKALHAELLRQASRPLEGIRPAILAPQRFADIDELRKFRHFFRRAYALDLRHDKLRRSLEPFVHVHRDIDADLAQFADFVRKLIDELREP